MRILITLGPTQEPLDAMRILSNRSTGKLGTQLALSLSEAGHQVIALRGTGATAGISELLERDVRILPFTTTEDLQCTLKQISQEGKIDAVFHAAAVSDFYLPGAGGGKIPTSLGSITLTLQPTPKLLPLLRGWFPQARITGWKFEATGGRAEVISSAEAQIRDCNTDACVLNGPAYGEGFGHLARDVSFHHLRDRTELCEFLTKSLKA